MENSKIVQVELDNYPPAASKISANESTPLASPRTKSVITLEGSASPDLPLAQDEQVLLDISQGWRDLGLVAKLMRHKGRLIITNRRAIVFMKKTKDYEVEQMRLSHAGYISMGHRLQMVKFAVAIFMVLGGIGIMISGAMAGAAMLVLGLLGMFTSRSQGLQILGSGGAMVFDTKSVSHMELAKVLTVINGTA